MKSIFATLLLALLSLYVHAQFVGFNDYEPTVNWPYLLKDFSKGIIVVGNDSVSKARFNFHLRSETLDCIDGAGKVARVLMPNIRCVIIDDEIYRFVDEKPMREVYSEDDAKLMEYEYIDYDQMDNGYMQGLALYARQNSDVSLQANWNGHLDYKNIHMPGEYNESYAALKEKRKDGQKLPVSTMYYFMVKGKSFRAIQSECNHLLDKDGQKQLKTIVKSNKLSWKNSDDLIKILRYMMMILN